MIEGVGAILLALASAALAAPPDAASAQTIEEAPAGPSAARADADFARLSVLVGEWKNAEMPESSLRIRFALTAGGTVLQESWFRGETLHSLTIYHRDGDKLVVTHYCPQGNQPMLAQNQSNPTLRFTFRSATDLDATQESYLHDLSFDLTNLDRPVRSEVYRSSEGDELSTLVMGRVAIQNSTR
ncbi:MAG: hypothetical protein ABL909_10730 [Sphingopyxis sp.]